MMLIHSKERLEVIVKFKFVIFSARNILRHVFNKEIFAVGILTTLNNFIFLVSQAFFFQQNMCARFLG